MPVFPNANHFVIKGSSFYEQHFHNTPPPPTHSEQQNSHPDSGERPQPYEVLPAGQYWFQNCEIAESRTCAVLIRYLPDIPGVAEILEVGFPGRALEVKGNICTIGEKPTKWFFERVGRDSEWIYIRQYDKPSKALTGRFLHGSQYGYCDMIIEEIEHRGAPIHLFKPIPIDVPANSGIVPPGYYIFLNISTEVITTLTYVRYKEEEFAVAIVHEVEMPGLYWGYDGQSCGSTRNPTEWCFETFFAELGGSGIFYIHPRHHPKRVVSGETVEGSPLGDLRIHNRSSEPSPVLWKAIPVDLPEGSGVLPAGIYKFVNLQNKLEISPTLVQYSNTLECLGLATLSVLSRQETFWTSTEVTCTFGAVQSKWFFKRFEIRRDIYYICPSQQPYPNMRVVSGETIDGEPAGDFIIQDIHQNFEDIPSTLIQLWMAVTP